MIMQGRQAACDEETKTRVHAHHRSEKGNNKEQKCVAWRTVLAVFTGADL